MLPRFHQGRPCSLDDLINVSPSRSSKSLRSSWTEASAFAAVSISTDSAARRPIGMLVLPLHRMLYLIHLSVVQALIYIIQSFDPGSDESFKSSCVRLTISMTSSALAERTYNVARPFCILPDTQPPRHTARVKIGISHQTPVRPAPLLPRCMQPAIGGGCRQHSWRCFRSPEPHPGWHPPSPAPWLYL